MKSSLLASAALPLGLEQPLSAPGQEVAAAPAAASLETELPKGRIAGQEFSRLMLGGNLIGGWAHSRDLAYVSMLMRQYNTPAKVRQTLEVAEANGITAINTWVMDDNTQIFDHWKAGGKMKWFAQTRLDETGGFSQLQKAVDQGAVGLHLTGDTAEGLIRQGEYGKIAASVEFIKAHKRIAGVGAHDLRVVVECDKAGLDVDFYQKTLHTHDYFSAQKPGDKEVLGSNDNSWCTDPQAVIDVMARVKKPFIAFKILAAGAVHPRTAFPWAFNAGADFILVGMFDWQIAENAKLARHVLAVIAGPNSKRTRPWC